MDIKRQRHKFGIKNKSLKTWNKEEFYYLHERCLIGKRRVNPWSQGRFCMVDDYIPGRKLPNHQINSLDPL